VSTIIYDRILKMGKGVGLFRSIQLILNPIASRRERLRLWSQIQTLRDRNKALNDKIVALEDRVNVPDNGIEANSLNSLNDFYSLLKDIDEYNRYYDAERLDIYRLFLDTLAANVEVKRNSRILDAGCGLGVFAKLMNERFRGIVCGFDFSDVAISQAQQNDGIKFFTHDIYDSLPERYDIIVCMETLEHLIEPEVAAQNLLRSLSNGGALFLTVPDGRIDRHARHINFWGPESWEIFIRKLCQESYDISFGMIQHPEVKVRRYNWAILKRRQE